MCGNRSAKEKKNAPSTSEADRPGPSSETEPVDRPGPSSAQVEQGETPVAGGVSDTTSAKAKQPINTIKMHNYELSKDSGLFVKITKFELLTGSNAIFHTFLFINFIVT